MPFIWELELIVKGVVNATGPFSDGLRKLDEPTTKEIVAPSSGVHITLPVCTRLLTLQSARG